MRLFAAATVTLFVCVVVCVAGCAPGRGPPPVPPCETTPGETAVGSTAFDVDVAPLLTRLEVLLGEDAGGPLRCVPGTGDCAACEGARFDVVVGEDVTVVVDIENGANAVPIAATIALTPGSDPAFRLLAPVPQATSQDGGPTPIFVGIAPVDVGALDAFVSITAAALNTSGRPPLLVGLHVNAVAP